MSEVEAMTRDELFERVATLLFESKVTDSRSLIEILESQMIPGAFGDVCARHSTMYDDDCIRRKGHDGYCKTIRGRQWQVIKNAT